jgi:hypothetical protein
MDSKDMGNLRKYMPRFVWARMQFEHDMRVGMQFLVDM